MIPAAQGFRCSRASLETDDDLAGTASTVRAFLLLEAEGAWGSAALAAKLLPEAVRATLRTMERRHGVRPLLVRRAGRRVGAAAPVNLFVAHTAGGWVEHTTLGAVEELLDLDVGGVRSGRRPGLTAYDGPLFLVCTHGRHDACCAERGRPVWRALAQAAPEHTWQVSHIGGDRFAANVIVLPEGLYYGRMEPADAVRLVAAHRDGRLLLERLRGRTSFSFSVQAAELYLRRSIGLLDERALVLVEEHRDGPVTTAVFDAGGRRWQVRVRTTSGEPRQLTCSATGASRPLQHELLSLE